MSEKLTVAALVALSVSKLEAELAANTYTPEELVEALELERAKADARSTAVTALEAALEAKPEVKGPRVADGKSVTSKRGILAGGKRISPADLAGGESSFNHLVKKGYIVK